jgi:hypothetical protein
MEKKKKSSCKTMKFFKKLKKITASLIPAEYASVHFALLSCGFGGLISDLPLLKIQIVFILCGISNFVARSNFLPENS